MASIFWVSQSACRHLLTVLAEDRLVARCLHKLHNTDTKETHTTTLRERD